MRIRTLFLLLAALGILIGLWVHSMLFSGEKKEVYRLGLAGPMTGDFDEVGLSMRRGVELAIDEINQNGELEGIRLELVVADDNSGLNASHRAATIASEMSADPKLLAVVGHYFSGPTLEASPVYDQNRVPLITPTATHPSVTAKYKNNFSIIPDNYYQSVFLANYVLHGLSRKKIGVIHTKNSYGVSLKDFFVSELRIKETTPVAMVEVSQTNFDPLPLLDNMAALQESEIIFLAMNYTNAAIVVKYLKDKGVESDFIGGESLGGPHFIRKAGVYAENVYAVTPYLPNLLGEMARRYEAAFVRAYQTNPDWVATHSYEAVRLIAGAIRDGGPDRDAIRRTLSRITREEDAVESISGAIYFNAYGSSRKPVAIGEVKGGRFVPARFQFTQVKYPELVKARKDKSRAFKMDGRFVKRTTVVFTGLHVNEIKSFDPIGENFVADFLLWFRWDPDKNRKLNFEMTYGQVLSAKIREKYFDEATHNNFIAYDVTARLDGVFPLHEYPFDRQTLRIRIKPKVKPKEDLILVTDIPDDSFLRKDLGLKGWKDIQHIQFTSQKSGIWSYRNPKYKKKLFELENAQFNYHIQLERKTLPYLIKLLPLVVIMMLAYSVFFINFEYTASRFTIGVTTLLSSMSFHNVIKVDVGYLVRIDVFFMSTYYLIFFAVAETVLSSSLHKNGRPALAAKVDLGAIAVYPFLMAFAVFSTLK